MTRIIEYPYNELTELEKERIDLYRGYHMADYKDIYVYYTTELDLGAGYRIIVTLSKVNNGDFGVTANDITDEDNLLKKF